METISASELRAKLDSEEEFVLIDVLGENSYAARHIPSAINIPLAQLGGRITRTVPDMKTPIVVYCSSRTCQASPTAARMLESLGYEHVVDFEDGLAGWQEAGYAFE